MFSIAPRFRCRFRHSPILRLKSLTFQKDHATMQAYPKYMKNKLLGYIETGSKLEARSGFEPLNKGFADLCLTTWLPRLLGRSLLGTYRAGPLKVNDSSRRA